MGVSINGGLFMFVGLMFGTSISANKWCKYVYALFISNKGIQVASMPIIHV